MHEIKPKSPLCFLQYNISDLSRSIINLIGSFDELALAACIAVASG